MTGLAGWSLAAGVNQLFLTSWVESLWNDIINEGTTTSITVGNYVLAIKDSPTVTIGGSKFDNALTLSVTGIITEQDSSEGSVLETTDANTGTVNIEINLASIFSGKVQFSTYFQSDGSSGSYADCGALPASLLTSGYSLGAWVYLESTSSQVLFSLENDGAVALSLSLTNSVPTLYIGDEYYTLKWDGAHPEFEVQTWHHVGVVLDVHDGNSPIARFYFDGQPQGSVSLSSIPEISTSYSLCIGKPVGSTSGLSGKLSGMSVWNSPLSDENVCQVMNADPSLGNILESQTCIGYWLFSPDTSPAAANLMVEDPSEGATANGNVYFVSEQDPQGANYTFLTTRDYTDVIYTTNDFPLFSSKLSDWINGEAETYVLEGAHVSENNADLEKVKSNVSYVGFVTEMADDENTDWSGENQLISLLMVGNRIAPSISTAKADLSGISQLVISDGCNSVVGVSDELFLESAATAINDHEGEFGTSSAEVNNSGSTPKLEYTIVRDKNPKASMDGSIQIKNGSGLKVKADGTFGFLTSDAWEVGFETNVAVTVVTINGKQYPQAHLFNTKATLEPTLENPLVLAIAAVTYFTALFFPLLIPLLGGALIVLTVEIYNRFNNFLENHDTFTFDNFSFSRYQVYSIKYYNGVFMAGSLNPQGCTITDVDPMEGVAGTEVTISGSNFLDSDGNSLIESVSIGGIVSTVDDGAVSGSPTIGTVVTSVVGGSGEGTPVILTTKAGSSSNAYGSFVVTNDAEPSDVHINVPDSDTSVVPGDTVTISGKYLNGTTSVVFQSDQSSNKPSAIFSVSSNEKIIAVVPDGINSITENAQWYVVIDNGVGTAQSDNYVTLADAPSITSISGPDGADYATAGDTITIVGDDFTNVDGNPMMAKFSNNWDGSSYTDEVECTFPDENDLSTVTVVVPEGAAGGSAANVVVRAPTGDSDSSSFSIVGDSHAIVSVASFEPTQGGLEDGYNTITVYGSNFTGTDAVLLDGTNCLYELDQDEGDSKLVITLPTESVLSSGQITVSNANGKSGTSTAEYEYLEKPVISSVSSSLEVGQTATITGKNFTDSNGDSVVLRVVIQSQSVTPTSVTSTAITFTIPETLSYRTRSALTVVSKGGSSDSVKVSVASAGLPTVTKIDPTSGSVGASQLTIYGTNFGGLKSASLVKGSTSVSFQRTSLGLENDGVVITTYVPVNSSLEEGTAYEVHVTNTVGTSEESDVTFTYTT